MQKKKHHNLQNYKCKIPGKKGNKYQVSFPEFMKHHSKKKQTNFPLKSSECWLWCTCFLTARRASPLCCCAGSTALNRLHPWWRICWYFSCFKVFTMILWHFWCDDNVNISALEFHHCHHVFVGYYLEYSWVFPSSFISNKDGHGIRMGAARFPAILNPHQCTAFLPIAMSCLNIFFPEK